MKQRMDDETYAVLLGEYEKAFIREIVRAKPGAGCPGEFEWMDMETYNSDSLSNKIARALDAGENDDVFNQTCDIADAAIKNIQTRLRRRWSVR